MQALSEPLLMVREAAPPIFPAWLRDEWLFWLVFVSWTLLPSTKDPVIEIGQGIRALGTDLALLPLCVIYLLPRLVAPCHRYRRFWHMGLPLAIVGICLYGFFSTGWSGAAPREILAMRYTMLVTCGSALFAYAMVTSVLDIRAFLQRLVIALAAVCLLYTAQSLLGLGLRSAEAVALNDFGMDRVRGPLFESSTGYFLLIPALAFALQETLTRGMRALYGIACAFAFSITILGLGSRAGYALFGVFAMFCVGFLKGRQRVMAATLLAAVGLVGGLLIFSKANTSRLHMEATEDARALTHETAYEIMLNRGAAELITGSGLGSWWPWYVTESDGGDIYLSGRYIHDTPYGITLYHPHSTILLMLVELGAPGAVFLLLLIGGLGRATLLAMRRRNYMIFAAGILVSVLSMDFDLFLVRRPTRDAVWWLLVFGLLALLGLRTSQSNEEWREG